MAARATWTGSIMFGLVNIPVSAYIMVDRAPGVDGYETKPICECCHEPFSQSQACPAGKAKDTDAARKRGETNLTPVLTGVKHGDDWVPLDDAAIEAATAASATPTIEVEFIDASEAPFYLSTGAYYLKAPSKDKSAGPVLALFQAALAQSGKVAIGRWAPRNRQVPVLIYDLGDGLVMNTLPFLAQIRQAADVAGNANPATVAKAVKLIDENVTSFDFADHEQDPVVEKYNEVIANALAGKPMPKAAAAPATTPAVDLDAMLEASFK